MPTCTTPDLTDHFAVTLAVFAAASPPQTCEGLGWWTPYKGARDIVSAAKFDLACGDSFEDVAAQVSIKLAALATEHGVVL